MLYKINYMVPEDTDMIGLEEDSKKNKGIAEFSFTDKEDLILPSIIENLVPMKKNKPKIIVKNGRRNTKSRESSELF